MTGETFPVIITAGNVLSNLYRYDIDEKGGSWMTCPVATWHIEGGEFYTFDDNKQPKIFNPHDIPADVDRKGVFGEKSTEGRTVWVRWFASDKPITRRLYCSMETGCLVLRCMFPKERSLDVTVLPDNKGGYYQKFYTIYSNPFGVTNDSKNDILCVGNNNYTFFAAVFSQLSSDEFARWSITDDYEIITSDNNKAIIKRKNQLTSNSTSGIITYTIYNRKEINRIIYQTQKEFKADPCDLINTEIFIDDNGTPQKEITKLVDHLENIKILGNKPRNILYPPNIICTYKWYISFDDRPFELIPNATGIDYILPFTRNSKTIVKRVTTAPIYIGNYIKENTVIINLATCTRPSVGGDRYTAFICDNETIYNCIPGNEYQFKRILGSPWSSPQKSSDDFRFKWFISNDAVNYSTSSALTGGDNDHWWADYSFRFTKDWTAKQTIYVKRKLEEYYSPDIWTSKAWRNIQNSNVVTLTMYAFDKPQNQKLKIVFGAQKQVSPQSLKCTDISGTYYLINETTNDIVNVDNLGIKNINWSIPQTWQGWSLTGKWATNITPNYTKIYNGASNIQQGGQIIATVEFEDGQKIPVTFTVLPPTPHDASVSPNNITVCNANVQVNVTPNNGSGNYSYMWDKWYVSPSTSNIVTVNGAAVKGTETIAVKITDNVSTCYITKNVTITNNGTSGKTGWAAYDISSANNTQIVSKITTDIITEKLGNPYYVGADGKIYYYQYIPTYWLNTSIPTTSNAAGPLAIYEPTEGNRTIYYSKTNGDLVYVTATGGTMNWSTPTATAGKNVGTAIKVDDSNNVFYKGTDNKIYSSRNNYTSEIVQIDQNSNFTVVNNRIYYLELKTLLITSCDYNGANKITYSTANGMTKGFYATVITHDNAGNVYYTADNELIYQIKKGASDITLTSSTFKCKGKFSVNKESGVLYAAAANKDIYQIYYNAQDGWWQPLLISVRQGGGPISNNPTTFGQEGAVTFRLPNVFYVSADGIIRVVQYNTASSCVGAYVRTDNNLEEVAPANEYKPIKNNIDLVLYPNPASQNVALKYTLPTDALVKITLQNTFGATIATPVSEVSTTAGEHIFDLDISNYQAGVYIVTLSAGNKVRYVKLIIN